MRARLSSSTTILCTDGAVTREEALHVSLGRGSTVDQGVGVDEGQVLALGIGEGAVEGVAMSL